ncbi:hypothetical protein I3843_02G089900 [Carya illinoinensis]|nr:hypothetical protein I3843_02G089900 [Carya illinoinensis]
MPRVLHALAKRVARPACCRNVHVQAIIPSQHDVFISHRGRDTRRNIAGLLYDNLLRLGLSPFLDYRNMKAGDKLYEKIDTVIPYCKVGVVVFSPGYCESLYCLHELALLMECQKKVIPIFYNVKPSQLRVGINKYNGTRVPAEKLERFKRALEEAKDILGLRFDSSRGYWSEFLQNTCDAITEQIAQNIDTFC